MTLSGAKKTGIAAALAATVFGISAAFADFPYDWYLIGGYNFGPELGNAELRLPGEVRYERLAIVARGADVRCRFIRIEFGNGTTQRLEGDRYNLDHEVRIDLAGDDRRITEIEFNCRSRSSGIARLEVYGR